MQNIFVSASKIVFILMALGIITLTFIGKVDAKDFVMLAGMAFSAYFANNKSAVSDNVDNSNTSVNNIV